MVSPFSLFHLFYSFSLSISLYHLLCFFPLYHSLQCFILSCFIYSSFRFSPLLCFSCLYFASLSSPSITSLFLSFPFFSPPWCLSPTLPNGSLFPSVWDNAATSFIKVVPKRRIQTTRIPARFSFPSTHWLMTDGLPGNCGMEASCATLDAISLVGAASQWLWKGSWKDGWSGWNTFTCYTYDFGALIYEQCFVGIVQFQLCSKTGPYC